MTAAWNSLQSIFLSAFLSSAPMTPFTAVCNATGVPAMSVPIEWTDDGLPVGMHFVARFGAEETLYSLAAQLEQARPWRNRRP